MIAPKPETTPTETASISCLASCDLELNHFERELADVGLSLKCDNAMVLEFFAV